MIFVFHQNVVSILIHYYVLSESRSDDSKFNAKSKILWDLFLQGGFYDSPSFNPVLLIVICVHGSAPTHLRKSVRIPCVRLASGKVHTYSLRRSTCNYVGKVRWFCV